MFGDTVRKSPSPSFDASELEGPRLDEPIPETKDVAEWLDTYRAGAALTDLGDGRTEMHFEQRGHMRPDEYDYAKQGWGTCFARIDERLAG